MKRPLLVIAVGYIIGIVWGLYCNCSIALFYAIVYLIFLLSKIRNRSNKKLKMFSIKRYFRYLKLILNFKVIIIIIIISIISNSFTIYQKNKYNNLYSNINKVILKGSIVSNPKHKENSKVYKIKVERLNEKNKYKNTYLLVYTKKDNNNEMEYGDKVLIYGEYKSPNIQRNYKGFNYKEFLRTKKIYGSVYVNRCYILEKNKTRNLFVYSNNLFLKIKNNIQNNVPHESGNLLLGIMLGYTDDIDENTMENFRDSNMSYILAVSGMHIMYIIIIITKILSKIIDKAKCRIVIIFILITYMFLTGFTTSIVRACTMGIIMMLSKVLYRKNDTWTSMSISVLIILIYNPFIITSISFLLSFGGTIGILLFNNIVLKFLRKTKVKDKKYKYKIIKYTKTINYIKETSALSISVQIIIMPIIVIFFNTISFSFLITNLLTSLAIGPLIFLGFLVIIISITFPEFLKFMSLISILGIKSILIISEIGSSLPFNKILIKTPNFIEIVLYYIIIIMSFFIYKIYNSKEPTPFEYRIRNIISLIKYRIKQNRNKVKSLTIIIVIVILFRLIPQNLKIYFVDVGQGDCTLITTPMRHTILIDGGGSTDENFDVGRSTLVPYLLDRRIKKIDYIIISHFDQDHVRTEF